MKLKNLLTALVAFLTIGFSANAQLICPPNIDFELGDLSGWTYYQGTCCPGGVAVATAPTPAIACRHTLTKATGLIGCTTPAVSLGPTDEFGGFPVVAPGGGSYSFKLGNKTTGGQAEKARFYIHIPSGSDNYSLIYRYAVVFQDPSHSVADQPQFLVKAFDSASGAPIPCADYTYVAAASIPGFLTSPVTSSGVVRYKGWTTSTIDLSGLSGTTVGIDFTSGDCALGGHFGYGYFDLNCGLFRIAAAICDTLVWPVLTAPEGFASYAWYDSATFTTLYGTGITITIPFPPGPVTIAVILTPYTGFGCPDTLYTTIRPANLVLHPSNDTAICRGKSAPLISGATDVALPLSYYWTPSTGLSCSTCPDPIATPSVSTAYTLTVTNANGCTQTHVYHVDIRPDLVTNITFDTPSCHGYTNGRATVHVTSGVSPYTYTWNTSPVQVDSTAINLPGDTFQVVVFDGFGCTDTNSVIILDPDPRIITIDTYYHPTTCLGSDGSIELSGSVFPDSAYTVSYMDDGIPQTRVITVTPGGKIILGGLNSGTYSDITIIGALCTYNIVGPVVLVDPPTPDLIGVTSNSFVCVNDTLKLFASSSMAGVSWQWDGPGGYSSGLANPILLPATMAMAGVYSVTVSRANCFNYGTTPVEIRPLPAPIAGSNTPVCSNDTLSLFSSSATGATSYVWNGPNFFVSFDQNPKVVHVQTVATGAYSVAITLDGCTLSTSVDIVVNQTPDAPVVADTNLCQNDVPVALNATGTNLLWYTGATGGTGIAVAPIPSTSKPGTYSAYVTQTSPEGCTGVRAKVSARVWSYPAPFVTLTDSVSCGGKYITFGTENIGEGSSRLTWQFENGDSIVNVNPISHAFNSVGTFTVTASAYYIYCPNVQMKKVISIYPYASMNLGPDTSICAGSTSIQLGAVDVNTFGYPATWKWGTGETTPKITIVAPGTYRATVTINGCESTDTIKVVDDCFIHVPNIFTPNNDGVNDYFFPRQFLTSGLIQFSMNIYNRWGQLIFTSSTLEGRGWDGKLNGVPQPEGVYVYMIDAVFKDGQKETHKGNVTLLR